jgi:hypothetical protein
VIKMIQKNDIKRSFKCQNRCALTHCTNHEVGHEGADCTRRVGMLKSSP